MSLLTQYGKGGARANYAKRLKFHDYSIYVAASVFIKKGTKILKSPQLDPAAAELLRQRQEEPNSERGMGTSSSRGSLLAASSSFF